MVKKPIQKPAPKVSFLLCDRPVGKASGKERGKQPLHALQAVLSPTPPKTQATSVPSASQSTLKRAHAPVAFGLALSFAALETILRAEVEKAGGQAAWARAHGLNRSNINEMLCGKRAISESVMNALGFVVRPVCVPVTEKAKTLCAQFNSSVPFPSSEGENTS